MSGTLPRGIWRFTTRKSSIETRISGAFLDKEFLDPVDPEKVLKLVIAKLAVRRRPCSGRVTRVQRSQREHKHVVIFVACT